MQPQTPSPPPYQIPVPPPLPNETVLYHSTEMQYPPNQAAYQPAVDKPGEPSAPFFTEFQATLPPVYQAPPIEHPTTLIVSQAVIPTLDRGPCNYKCPMCHYQVMTDVTFRNSTTTYLMCLGLFGIGCLTSFLFIGILFWVFCCIPLFMREFKDAVHSCPNCSAHIGTVKPTLF